MKEEDKKKKKRKNQLKNWAVFTGIGFEMGGTIFVCAWIGQQLDERYSTDKKWFTMGFVLFGLVSSLFLVFKQLKKFDN